jgi:hypothetical protein
MNWTSPDHERLVSAWRDLCGTSPFILKGDEYLVQKELCHPFATFRDYVQDPRHGLDPEYKFHTGLFPVPYVGRLDRARVFILMTNPGFGPHDYFGEHEVDAFRAAMLANLRQELVDGDCWIPYLNPAFFWHGGFAYWRQKLRDFIGETTSVSVFKETLRNLASSVAFIEAIPYHSARMAKSVSAEKLSAKLRSTFLITKYVEHDLIPRARSGEILVLCLRGPWGLAAKTCKNVIVYEVLG